MLSIISSGNRGCCSCPCYQTLEGQVPVFISPKNRVAQLYPSVVVFNQIPGDITGLFGQLIILPLSSEQYICTQFVLHRKHIKCPLQGLTDKRCLRGHTEPTNAVCGQQEDAIQNHWALVIGLDKQTEAMQRQSQAVCPKANVWQDCDQQFI
jgi:hypothetical protein